GTQGALPQARCGRLVEHAVARQSRQRLIDATAIRLGAWPGRHVAARDLGEYDPLGTAHVVQAIARPTWPQHFDHSLVRSAEAKNTLEAVLGGIASPAHHWTHHSLAALRSEKHHRTDAVAGCPPTLDRAHRAAKLHGGPAVAVAPAVDLDRQS